MNYPSFYQGDMFRALIASGRVDLQVVFAKKLTPDRLQLGWEDDLRGYPYTFINRRKLTADAMRLAWAQRDRVHIVNGIWAEPAFTAALVALAFAGASYAIYSEAPEPYLRRSVAKKALRAGFGQTLAAKAKAVFPISHLAEDFYARLGVSRQTMYPFGYFRSAARWLERTGYSKPPGVIELVFAGQIVHRKGLDLLLEALLPLSAEHQNLRLSIVGDGDLLPTLRTQVEQLGLAERVTFQGVISPDRIPARLSVADLLVLPSRWDGWGVVVNEAFSVGIPVIASDQCGASDLIRSGENGYVFRCGDAQDLRVCLQKFLSQSNNWPRLRADAAVTGTKISTEAAAPYLIECLRHMTGLTDQRPSPPWSVLNVAQGAG